MQVAKFTRRFKDEDDEYQNTCEFFSHIVDLAIYSIPQDRAGPFEAMYHVVDDTRRFYSIREVHRIVIGSVKSHFLFFFLLQDPEYVEFTNRVESRKQIGQYVAPVVCLTY